MNAHTIVRFFALASSEPATRLQDGSLLLVHPPAVVVLLRVLRGAGLVALAIGVVAGMLWQPAMFVLALLGLLGFHMARRELRITVLLDDDGIAVRGADGSHRHARWADLADVRFRGMDFSWRLQTRDGERLRFPAMLRGGPEFPLLLRQHTGGEPWQRFQLAVRTYYKTLRRFGAPVRVQHEHAGVATGATSATGDDDGDDE
jgi:hypothetical protein